jgi:hypothetical protein
VWTNDKAAAMAIVTIHDAKTNFGLVSNEHAFDAYGARRIW